MELKHIETDSTQRELVRHGGDGFPLEVNHDRLYDFFDSRISCHWHEELEIPVVVQGSIRYTLRDQSLVLGTGEGIVINSHVPHSALPLDGEEPVLITTVFSPSLLYDSPAGAIYQKLLKPYLNSAGLACLSLDSEGVKLMHEIDVLYYDRPFGWELKASGSLRCMFAQLLSQHEHELERSRPADEQSLQRLRILIDAIQSSSCERVSLNELAASISVSRESCCRFFKSMTGQTISQYLADYRVSRGAQLLRDGGRSVTQVAYAVGFGNAGRFSTAFAERMGCTPSEYRRALRTAGKRE